MEDVPIEKLAENLENWDGKHVNYLVEIYDGLSSTGDFINQTVGLFNKDEKNRKVTTWLLKHYLEVSQKINPDLTILLLNKIPQVENWEAKLHILQIVCLHPESIKDKLQDGVLTHMYSLLSSKKKFLQASAVEALSLLENNSNSINKLIRIFEEKLLNEDTSPSIKVKLKKALKSLK